LPYDAPAGNYTFSQLGSFTGSYITDSTWVAQTGNLIITKNHVTNKHIEGTFEFDAEEFHTGDVKLFRNGMFSVDYY